MALRTAAHCWVQLCAATRSSAAKAAPRERLECALVGQRASVLRLDGARLHEGSDAWQAPGRTVRDERAASIDDRLRGWRRRVDRGVRPGVPGALSQGRTRAEARENVIDALHGILELRFGEHALTEPASDSEPLELTIAA